MRVLILGPNASRIGSVVEQAGDKPIDCNGILGPELVAGIAPDWVVSYGYRKIIPKAVLDMLPDRFVNLHISLLPYNRGAHPNFWSYAECTPAGVSIHLIDQGIDTGDLLYQLPMKLTLEETLSSSYEKLSVAVELQFAQNWRNIRSENAPRLKQPAGGTFHKLKDIERFKSVLTEGWNTPVARIAGIALTSSTTGKR